MLSFKDGGVLKVLELGELLYDYPYMDEKIAKIKAEITRLCELKEDERNSTLKNTNEIIERYEQQLGDLKGLLEGFVSQQDKLRLALFELSSEEYRFVKLKYFERMKVEVIIRELKRSRRSFYRLGDKVLEKLSKRLLIAKNIFLTTGGALVSKRDIKIIDTTTDDIYDAPGA